MQLRNRPVTPMLAVIGAGPKGLAIAAKAHVLADLGVTTPNIVVVDRHGVASHWTGERGFTDGRRLLGTGPEKDVGFPYFSKPWGDLNGQVNERMLAYSWHAYLVDQHTFGYWIDQGRQQPTHAEWAAYLQWVAAKLGLSVERYEVALIDRVSERWKLSAAKPGWSVEADGLVITGPGPVQPPFQIENCGARVWNGQDFWQNALELERLVPRGEHIAVVGSGETAAAILVAIVEARPDVQVEVITTRGISYSRGESFEENRVYTDPESVFVSWSDMSPDHRREFTDRTDRGVFSIAAKSVLDRSQKIKTFPGEVTSISESESEAKVTYRPIAVENADLVTVSYKIVIVATAFDAKWFIAILSEQAKKALIAETGGNPDRLEDSIGRDLSIEGLTPRLHLPMLAGFRQGPGFPNLSSLGLLSDRVLESYVRRGNS